MRSSFSCRTLFFGSAGVALTLLLGACQYGTEAAAKPATAAPESARQTPSGEVVGFDHPEGAHAWLGIPYAAPPVGDLRWRAPRPVAPWQGRRATLAFASPCVQIGSPLGGVGKGGEHAGNEDCLYLNVYAPRMSAVEATKAKLPVMLWIHGGGNTIGHGGFYDGGHLAVAGKAVVITFNYRLGPFGWFMHPALAGAAEGSSANPSAASGNPLLGNPLDASGNWGTLDTIAALHWVRSNASVFGGDPTNVTVFGESAGGTNVMALLISPLTQGLFHRAIVQSGGLGFSSVASGTHFSDDADPGHANSSAEVLTRLLIADGRATDRAAAKAKIATMNLSEIAAYLRGKDAWTVFAAFGTKGLMGPNLPSVFQDGAVLRQGDPLKLLGDPATHIAVPTLLGTNRDEPKIFMAFDPNNVYRAFGVPLMLKNGDDYDRKAKYGAMSWKLRAVDEIATALTNAGQTVYTYRWDWDEEGSRLGFINLSKILGAAHGLEIPFVFGHFDLGPQTPLLFNEANAPGRKELSDAMVSYWANFAKRGTPDRGLDDKLVPWAAWTNMPGVPKLMLLASNAGGGTRMSDLQLTRDGLVAAMAQEPISTAERCALFDNTFRFDRDKWANEEQQKFEKGACVGQQTSRGAP